MKKMRFLPLILAMCLVLSSCGAVVETKEKLDNTTTTTAQLEEQAYTLDNIPEYNGSPYIELNENQPEFYNTDYTTKSFEKYYPLDSLGRCQVAYACIGTNIMPTEERGNIGMVKPSGWHTVKYDNVDGKYLYNRCHLIGYQLSAENANERNLITGTRYMNVDGMLDFENEVASYVKSTKNHVLYRVTPIFVGNELVARGVQMEAYSVEDKGEGVSFNIYCYNVQPGIEIDYATGDSRCIDASVSHADDSKKQTYIININTKKFHKQSCSYAEDISKENKKAYIGYKESLINNGYSPCGSCKP